MPHAVIGLIGAVGCTLLLIILFIGLIGHTNRKSVQGLLWLVGLAAVGFYVFMCVSVKNTKQYSDKTVVLASATTVDQLCKQMRPEWHVHTCRQQILVDNVSLVGLKRIPQGTRVFVNGFNYFQWNV